jgi:NADPH-dependent glutamate synthase beta subunit-like oxidoreductase/NAD-dependent dihydropyrimidine dehydrogenase PreA subunit
MGLERYGEFVKRAQNVLTYDPGWSEENLTGLWRRFRPKIKERLSPCQHACPLDFNVKEFLSLLKGKKLKEAALKLNEKTVLPSVCARVCPALCEDQCLRSQIDTPLAIREIKRFVTDKNLNLDYPAHLPKKEIKVAIIGAGPAGLTVARELSLLGYKITLFDAQSFPGGLLYYGIPNFRLPKDLLNNEISKILRLGVEFKPNTTLGKDLYLEDLFKDRYQAIFLGLGASKEIKLNIPGEDLKGVINGIGFLKKINSGEKIDLGRNIFIVGGGNAAIDTARTCIRLQRQAKVTILYRRTRKEMPALKEEIEAALKEGIKIMFLKSPIRFLGKNKRLSQVEIISMRLESKDSSGRPKPVPIPGSETTLPADMVILAIGQAVDTSLLDLETTRAGTIKTDHFFQTSIKGVFAGGDVTLGPSTVPEAIKQGKMAAQNIDRFLQKKRPLSQEPEREVVKKEDLSPFYFNVASRIKSYELDPRSRVRSFEEVFKGGLATSDILKEAERCLGCGSCTSCGVCWLFCPDGVIELQEEPSFDLDYCKGCAICVTECPRGALILEEEVR